MFFFFSCNAGNAGNEAENCVWDGGLGGWVGGGE